jgi:phosphoribosylformylglycinamidine (FGAM) synthase-like enzyme
MMAIVEPQHLDRFLEITGKWDVEATVIGEVTDGDRLVVTWHGETIVDVPPRSVAHDGPVYQRPLGRPAYLDALQQDETRGLERPVTGQQLRATMLTLLGSPNLCDKSWVTKQYDRYVMGNTALAMPDDAGVVPRRRGDRTRRRGLHRLQRPVHQARPVCGCAARAGGGVSQRRDGGGGAAGRHRLPQLRVTGGPRGDVAVP